ncbi:hypothetical protein E0L36_10880 [Streptomyces sp. AJS327]|uniref:hypothetical protein n=1 Tax=Streptomyces sp. AJS327 TaxID=2545265 RepID=UPI0015DF62F4|nr:hypothetical protein [Streptomyces sp. AJS327]MBA0051374.1 hypothetical protein [Streptomyces sp. AJS327]
MSWEIWAYLLLGAILSSTLATVVRLRRATAKPLPALDRTPRTATVTHLDDGDGTGTPVVWCAYHDAEGNRRTAGLADLVEESWRDRFTPGSRWEVHAFREPSTRVFLTEAHEEVVRLGYNLDGVRLGGESGPVPVGPGSPFLHGKWRFANDAAGERDAR